MCLRDSSSDEEEEEEVKKEKPKKKKKAEHFDSEGENGFLSDGYDADLYGDSEDRARLTAMTEVEREAILYERAQARQARQERRALEQRIREREEGGGANRRAVPKAVDLKRKKLDELKAKRQKRREGRENEEDEESEEEGEFDDEDEDDEDESEIESEEERRRRQRSIATKKKSKKHRAKKDSDDDYYTEDDDDDRVIDVVSKKTGGASLKSSDDNLVNAQELDLDLANKLRLTRDILAQWVYRDGFEDIVQRALLRINLGPGRSGQPTYRLVELKKLVQNPRTYLIKPGTPTNLAALVKFAKNERIFSFEFVSNSPFTASEFAYWKAECERAGVKLPYNSVTARRKIDKFKAFNAEPLTDSLIQNMLQRRKELTTAQNAPRNLLAEQTILQQQLKEALERGTDADDEEIARIEAELASITAKRQQSESKDRLAAMEDLNKRNRQVNLETGRQAEISRLQAELPSLAVDSSDAMKKKAPTLDPFQRRKCKPTLIHMNDNNEEPEPAVESVKSPVSIESVEGDKSKVPGEIATPITATNAKPSTDLFDAHNFDLDLDL